MKREPEPRKLSCPTCKKPFAASSEGARRPSLPFCSERCKMADLGRWLGGEYSVPSNEPPTEEAYLEALREQEGPPH